MLAGGLLAYVGPGAGLGLLSALIGLLLAVGSAAGFILLWPLRSLLKKLRSGKQALVQHRQPAD